MEPMPMEHCRILVVEDEWVIRELIVEALRDAGYDVIAADNGDAAARLLGADGFDLLVTDVHMPGKLDGIALAQQAQLHKPPLAVVFVTGRPDVLERVRAGDMTSAVVSKPFMTDDVVRTVRHMLTA
jgi:DNA-binding response OmpR family regulator